MRQLTARRHTPARAQRGLTLVELVVAFFISALLVVAAAPSFSEYGTNSRLRESGNTLYAEALFAQSEAIKRNRVVRVSTSGATVQVADVSVPAAPVVLRTRTLANGVQAATDSIDFGTQGWTSTLTAGAINLSHSGVSCSADQRCPGLRVEAGGAIRLCGNYLASCP